MKKPRIFKRALAEVTREICQKLYEKFGSTKVYDYANTIKLSYSKCNPCDAETPTIADSKECSCAICGSEKHFVE